MPPFLGVAPSRLRMAKEAMLAVLVIRPLVDRVVVQVAAARVLHPRLMVLSDPSAVGNAFILAIEWGSHVRALRHLRGPGCDRLLRLAGHRAAVQRVSYPWSREQIVAAIDQAEREIAASAAFLAALQTKGE